MFGRLLKHITIFVLLLMSMTTFGQEIPDFGTPKKLDFKVNSAGLESAPFFVGNRMYFSRHLYDGNKGGKTAGMDVWYSDYNPAKKTWSNAKNDMGPINDKNHNAVVGVSTDGNTLYLINHYFGKGYAKPGISFSTKDGNSWSDPENILIPEMYLNGVCGFFMDKSEEVLFISYSGKETFGQEDLYVSLKGDSSWSEPINLGSKINSKGYEMSPFLADDGKTLYFAASAEFRGDGHGGDGHADVFISTRLDDTYTNWTEPVNMGDKINTEEFEGYFIKPEGEYFYFVRSSTGTGDDIFRVKIGEDEEEIQPFLTVSGLIFDEITKEPLIFELIVKDEKGKKKVETIVADNEGHYEVELDKGETFTFNILEKGYHEHHDEVEMPTIEDSVNTMEYNLPMKKLIAGTKIEVERLYFKVSTDTLREVSISEVDKLTQILLSNPDINIEIQGHTDNSGSYAANRKLSEDRAKAIKKMLIHNGVKRSRLKAVGYGESKPLVKNLTEEDRKKNRRVDFVIID